MTVRVAGLDHVLLAMPQGDDAVERARHFWVDIVGLREVERPPELADRAGGWFIGDAIHIHCGAEVDFRPARKAHPALLIDDLATARRTLEDAGVTVIDDDSGFRARRCYIDDPFGNRIELIDARDGGFTAQQAAVDEAGPRTPPMQGR